MRLIYVKSTIAIVLLLLIGCSALGSESQGERREQAMTILLWRDNDMLPIAECGRKEVATQMALFFDAFNRGDEEVIAQFFDDKHFDFFGGSPLYDELNGGFIESSDLVLPELIDWHQKGERIYLERMQILYSPGSPPEILSFNYLLARENLNTSPQIRHYESKGQLFCDSEGVRLLKWSSGRYVPGRHSNCSKPSDDLVESEVVIACG